MVDEGDVAGQRREVKRLFNGTVAAADDGDVTSGELCAVAFRAGAYAVARSPRSPGTLRGRGAEPMARIRAWPWCWSPLC